MVNQSGAIYWYQCGDLGCDEEYIGETCRTFGERNKEHLKATSAIHHQSSLTGHSTNHNNFQIIGREGHNLARNIKESIFIRVNNPTLNYNIDKFNLPHIWDRVLFNTPGLILKGRLIITTPNLINLMLNFNLIFSSISQFPLPLRVFTFTLPSMHLSMVSKHFRVHISTCFPVPFQT